MSRKCCQCEKILGQDIYSKNKWGKGDDFQDVRTASAAAIIIQLHIHVVLTKDQKVENKKREAVISVNSLI